jgi:hypothetical protein
VARRRRRRKRVVHKTRAGSADDVDGLHHTCPGTRVARHVCSFQEESGDGRDTLAVLGEPVGPEDPTGTFFFFLFFVAGILGALPSEELGRAGERVRGRDGVAGGAVRGAEVFGDGRRRGGVSEQGHQGQRRGGYLWRVRVHSFWKEKEKRRLKEEVADRSTLLSFFFPFFNILIASLSSLLRFSLQIREAPIVAVRPPGHSLSEE